MTHSLVTIDSQGELSNFLEVEHTLRSSNWNALVGEQQRQYNLKLRVKLAQLKNHENKINYIIDPETEGPFDLRAEFLSKDRFFDTIDYQRLKERLSYISMLSLDKYLPSLPTFAKDQELKFKQQKLYDYPLARNKTIAPTPVLLGKAQSQLSIYFPHKFVSTIARLPKNRIIDALEIAFSDKKLATMDESSTYSEPNGFFKCACLPFETFTTFKHLLP